MFLRGFRNNGMARNGFSDSSFVLRSGACMEEQLLFFGGSFLGSFLFMFGFVRVFWLSTVPSWQVNSPPRVQEKGAWAIYFLGIVLWLRSVFSMGFWVVFVLVRFFLRGLAPN